MFDSIMPRNGRRHEEALAGFDGGPDPDTDEKVPCT